MSEQATGTNAPLSASLFTFAKTHRHVPTLSLYLNREPQDAAGRSAQRVELQHALDVARRRLDGESKATRAMFDSCERRLHIALARRDGAMGLPAFACFVSANGDALFEPLAVPTDPSVAWRNGARIAPYLLAAVAPPALVALVDSEHATIFRLTGETLAVVETRDDHPDADVATHMGSAPRERFHAGTRGETQTDAAARVRREVHARHVTATAQRGSSATVPLVLRSLPLELSRRAAAAESILTTSTVPEIVALAQAALRALAGTRQNELLADLLNGARHTHHAALGFAEVSRAIALHAVNHLLVSSAYVREYPDAIDDAVQAVLEGGGRVEVVGVSGEETLETAAAGIAARLRFAVPAEASALPPLSGRVMAAPV